MAFFVVVVVRDFSKVSERRLSGLSFFFLRFFLFFFFFRSLSYLA